MGASDALTKRIEDAERKAQQAADQLKQLKARKASIEARHKAIEAKRAQAAEQRRKFEVGGLVKKAGLLDLDAPALLGALLMAADKLGDLAYLAEARGRGEAALAVRSAPTNGAA
jgi:Conjugal transfer protein TraD